MSEIQTSVNVGYGAAMMQDGTIHDLGAWCVVVRFGGEGGTEHPFHADQARRIADYLYGMADHVDKLNEQGSRT